MTIQHDVEPGCFITPLPAPLPRLVALVYPFTPEVMPSRSVGNISFSFSSAQYMIYFSIFLVYHSSIISVFVRRKWYNLYVIIHKTFHEVIGMWMCMQVWLVTAASLVAGTLLLYGVSEVTHRLLRHHSWPPLTYADSILYGVGIFLAVGISSVSTRMSIQYTKTMYLVFV